jgi:hypothetical protein
MLTMQQPDSEYKVNESIYLKTKDGKPAGPFCIVRCHAPGSNTDRWRYDVKDKHGKTMDRISASKFFDMRR